MTDGNTDAINRHLAEREAYDEMQEALEAVEKLAEAEERIEALEARNEKLGEASAYATQRITELEAQLAKVTAERDEWRYMVGAMAATVPLNKTLSATATLGDLVQYFKDLHNRAEAAEAALPRAYRMGLEDALTCVQGLITPYEKDMAKIGQILAENKRPSVRYRILRAGVDTAKAIVSKIRAIPTPTDLMERATQKAKGEV